MQSLPTFVCVPIPILDSSTLLYIDNNRCVTINVTPPYRIIGYMSATSLLISGPAITTLPSEQTGDTGKPINKRSNKPPPYTNMMNKHNKI